MPFGLKRTTGISGHYSEAQSRSMQKSLGDAEVGGKQWKSVEVSGRQVEGPEDVQKRVKDQEGVGRGQGGPEGVGKAVGEGRRGRKTWESNSTLHDQPPALHSWLVLFAVHRLTGLPGYVETFL